MVIGPFAVAPVLVGPLQVLLAILPGLLLSLGGLLLALLRPRVIKQGLKLMWRQKIAVGALVVVTGLAFHAKSLFPGQGPVIVSEETGARDWPMFRGDLQRRGACGSGGEPTRGGLNWGFSADCRTFYASPAVVGNRVYVTSADKGPLRDRGAVYCLDADTGSLVWKKAPHGYLATFSSPAVAGRFLVCGEGLHYTRSARVVCLDVSLGGEILWTYPTRSHVESSPCIDQDRVYVGAGDDGYYCFRLQPDAAGQPLVVWHVSGTEYSDAETSPAVCDGKVFVGLGMQGKAICCLHAETGAEIWRVATPYPVFGPPTVVGDVVVVGMGNGNFIQSAEEVRRIELEKLQEQGKTPEEIAAAEKLLGPAGEVWCLSAETGHVQWKYRAGQTILGAVAAGKDRLYFGARTGFLYSLSSVGKELARWNAHAPLVTSPALAGNHVYVVTETGQLYGLRADDLELVWEATLGFTGPFLSSPTVARGHIYVGSQQDGLLCLGTPGVDAEEPCWAGHLGGPGAGGNIDRKPLPERGKFAWRFPRSADPEAISELSVTAPPACLGQFLYVPVHGRRSGVICLQDDPQSRDPAAEIWFAESPHGVRLSPVASSQAVFFVDGQQGDQRRHLHCVEAVDGSPRWQLPVAAEASGALVLFAGGGLIADQADGLACYDDRGRVAWRNAIGSVRGAPAWCDMMVVAAVESPPSLVALDLPSGAALWRVRLPSGATTGPVIRKKVVYLGTQQGISAFNLVDGGRLWESQGGQPAGALAVDGDRLGYVSAAADLVIVSPRNGEVLKKISGALSGMPPLVARGGLLYAGKSGLMRYEPESDDASLWMRTAWLGQFTAPVVMANSRVYFGTDKRGLVCAKGKQRR